MSADIDLDFADREQVLKLIQHIPARQTVNGQVRRHNSGVYVTDIPYDPVNECAAIDYQTAEQRGYFKIDFLNMHVYKLVQSPEHYQQMIDATPPWQRLWQDPEWAKELVHIGNYTEERFKDIWNSNRYWKIQDYLSSKYFAVSNRGGLYYVFVDIVGHHVIATCNIECVYG